MTRAIPERPRVLIEDWLPVAELGIESRREAAPIPGQFPKLKTLHVWWARRPLVASAGAVLASVMPSWSPELAAKFPDWREVATEFEYRAWFLRLCGILGDPVAAKARAARNKALGVRTADNPYDYKPAFKSRMTTGDLARLQELLDRTWSGRPDMLDPTAGGGSIPYAALRFGIGAHANDLNPVAAAILDAGVRLPAECGPALSADIQELGHKLVDRITQRLEPYFPSGPHERITNYLFARTVACPRTGKKVPLSPNWWLSRGAKPIAVRLLTRPGTDGDRIEYEIVAGNDIDFDPERGTVAGGDAVSPWDGLAIDGEYIRGEAQAGRMGSELYAVAVRTPTGRVFRAPTPVDAEALVAAEVELSRLLPLWLEKETVPTERMPAGNDNRPTQYGMGLWRQMFSPRQLLVHGTFVEEFRRLVPEALEHLGPDRGRAVLTLLALMQGKAVNFNAIMASWHASRNTMRSVFERHDFAFKWTYAEFEGARELYPWCLDQIIDGYREIADLLRPADPGPLADTPRWSVPGPVAISCRNAADLRDLEDRSVTLVCIDPPYYDNVMYAELADFFYVWEKRTLGMVRPELFADQLTDKKNEAVANQARFADTGPRRKVLANADYEAKMAAIFSECSRVLRDAGVLTVMFTHKRAEAWDTLGMGLLEAGFRIEASWPVNTESEQSLHQANKNAAASTILLVCRKRDHRDGRAPFFDDLESEVRSAARDALERFSHAGLTGVDLLLSTYGPALSVISSHWPVYSSDADPITGKSRLLRPEEALDAARAEVVRLQRRRLVGTEAKLDPLTDFVLIAWETFKAAEFPFDEARRLALATGGLDIDELERARVLEKKAGSVVLLTPDRRLRRSDDGGLPGVRPEATVFSAVIDAAHTAMFVAAVDGLPAARALIDRAGLASDARFLACLQGLVNAIPRTRTRSGWARKEAEILDRLCAAYFPSIQIPPDPDVAEALDLGL
jgi:putative DNA methylase